ncbi:MAG: ATP-grasp domain-containing protein [Deltaproteobacteria bacterium]|nr:ATP-grasp domain-containing protein [Deltaproteobacteria bacterium]
MDDVIIIFGSDSNERRVSVASAQNIVRLLPQARLWFWSPSGSIHFTETQRLLDFVNPFENDFDPGSKAIYPTIEAAINSASSANTFFLALHGKGGEDGMLQALLEAKFLPFSGSSSQASHRAFDKVIAKKLVQSQNIRTAESTTIISGNDTENIRQILANWQQQYKHIVIKPVADGSSVGLHFVNDTNSLDTVIAQINATPNITYLVEAFISGKELTVVVIDTDKGPKALPGSEIVVEQGRAFDFAGKYLGKGTKEITPANVTSSVHALAGEIAVAAHKAIGCYGYSRTDLIINDTGAIFLEINTLPGLTKASFVPQQLTVADITMSDFLMQQIQLARRRYEFKQNLPFTKTADVF